MWVKKCVKKMWVNVSVSRKCEWVWVENEEKVCKICVKKICMWKLVKMWVKIMWRKCE